MRQRLLNNGEQSVMSPIAPCIRQLQPLQILSLAENAPAVLTVLDGVVWLTKEDGEDIILAVGECTVIDEGVTAVASVLEGAASFERTSSHSTSLARAV